MASSFFKTTGGLLVGGVATYGGYRYYEVWQAERECSSYQKQSAQHSNVIQQSQASILNQEKLAEQLFATRREQQKAVSKAEGDVSEAQKRLLELEQQKEELDKQLQQTQKAVLDGKQRTDKLLEEIRSRIEARTMADKALAAAQQHAQQVRDDANPLQHPLVRNFLGRR